MRRIVEFLDLVDGLWLDFVLVGMAIASFLSILVAILSVLALLE